MTLEKLYGILKKTGLSVAYDFFEKETAPPYVACIETGRTPIYADNAVYAELKTINIELYTKRKSPECEKLLENVLKENEIFYTFTGVGLIESEDIYEVFYSVEI